MLQEDSLKESKFDKFLGFFFKLILKFCFAFFAVIEFILGDVSNWCVYKFVLTLNFEFVASFRSGLNTKWDFLLLAFSLCSFTDLCDVFVRLKKLKDFNLLSPGEKDDLFI